MPEDENSWDKSKVRDQYERHTGEGGFLPRLSVPSLSVPSLDGSKEAFTSKKAGIAAGLILLLLAVGVYSGFLTTLVLGPESAAKNIASQDPVIQEFKSEFDTVEEASEVPASTVEKLKSTGQIPQGATEVYIVDYTNEEGQGVSAYVSLDSGKVLSRKRSFSIN